MHAFLRSIADGYYRSEQMNIQEYTFVFPNSRSAQYFKMYLGEQTTIDGTKLKGMTLTMSELFEKGAGMRRASRNKLLMAVYAAYCKVSSRMNPGIPPQEFDRFRFWGEMLVRDFDEIDRYLIDPKQIFRNVADYKEIRTYYLTEEQQEIIRDFWGEDPYWNHNGTQTAGAEKELPFWSHINHESSNETPDGKFMQLWQMMLPIYEEFQRLLRQSGECYPGMACREVVRILKQTGRLPFNPKKYVFIGFHRLTMSEHVVFDEMQRLGMAHFYWDYDPALMNPETGNKAGRFIANYVKYFTSSLPAVQLPPGGGTHCVDVIGVGSNVGQAKVAAQLLEKADTAVVLPSDDMLLPLITSIPERFTQINITMGCPLRYSQLSQLYSSLVSLQIHARRYGDGRVEFFRNDVMRLLANPLLRATCSDELTAIADLMKEKRLYNLPEAEIQTRGDEFPIMSVMLTCVEDNRDIRQVAAYTRNVLSIFDADDAQEGVSLEEKAVKTLLDEIEELESLSLVYDIKMADNTFFRMLEQSLFHRSLSVKGISFEALQIMGVLETRGLGFKNVMMLSMTDTVYPGRTASKSFIPDSLRHAYGMPTAEHYESDSAYYFFRILSNSTQLTLLYDSRTGGLRSGEKSRFIEQLLHVPFPGVKITCSDANFSSSLAEIAEVAPLLPPGLEIAKNDRIMERLNRYLQPDAESLKKYKLSASALKTYLHCPMQFYLERVEDMRPADPVKENIDQGIIGNIEHEAAERLYERLPVRAIDRKVIDTIIDGGYDDILNREIRRAFNVNYVGIPGRIPDPEKEGAMIENPEAYSAELFGQAMVYEPAIRQALVDMLNAEPLPFTFCHGELSETFSWRLTPELAFNFTMKIDRVDLESGMTRLVDYKTGKDKTDFTESNVLKRESPDLRAGIFQLLTYCYAYLSRHKDVEPDKVKPIIYTLKSIPRTTTFPDLKLGTEARNVPLTSYAQVSEWFEPAFRELIREIFNPEVPFRSTTNPDMCTYCKFQRFCHTSPLTSFAN